MMAKQIPYTIVKQVSFDVLAPLSLSVLRPELAIYAVIGSAFVSSVLSTLSSHPGDMLLSVVNSSKSKRQLRTLAREILERDGVKGFFTGLNARFLHGERRPSMAGTSHCYIFLTRRYAPRLALIAARRSWAHRDGAVGRI